MSQQKLLLRRSSFRKGQSHERECKIYLKKKMGRGFKEKEEREALSEAINSKKKKKIIIKIVSPALLSFSRNKNKNKTIKYKLSRYCGNVQESGEHLSTCAFWPGRGTTQRNELLKKHPPKKRFTSRFYQSISIRVFSSSPHCPSPNKKG